MKWIPAVENFGAVLCFLTTVQTNFVSFSGYFIYFIHFLKFIYLFIFGCVGSLLLHEGFLQLWRAGATLHCSARVSHCGGFSCCRARALGVWASVVVARRLSSCGSRALECRLSSCGTWAQLLHGMWDLPGPGLEPMSPALAGRFLTTVPPGKSLSVDILNKVPKMPTSVLAIGIRGYEFTYP